MSPFKDGVLSPQSEKEKTISGLMSTIKILKEISIVRDALFAKQSETRKRLVPLIASDRNAMFEAEREESRKLQEQIDALTAKIDVESFCKTAEKMFPSVKLSDGAVDRGEDQSWREDEGEVYSRIISFPDNVFVHKMVTPDYDSETVSVKIIDSEKVKELLATSLQNDNRIMEEAKNRIAAMEQLMAKLTDPV